MTAIANAPATATRAAGFLSLRSTRGRPGLIRQALLQALCLFILLTVLFPVVWVFSVSLDPLNRSRPEGLTIIPAGATLDSYRQVLARPTNNPISFLELTANSLKIALSTSIISVIIGVFAAYAFSRLRFRGRELLMLVILGVLMLPAVAAITPLFVLLN